MVDASIINCSHQRFEMGVTGSSPVLTFQKKNKYGMLPQHFNWKPNVAMEHNSLIGAPFKHKTYHTIGSATRVGGVINKQIVAFKKQVI